MSKTRAGATALAFAKEPNHAIIVADVNDEGGKKVVEEVKAAGGEASYVHLDVSKEDDWVKAIQFTVQTYGKLTCLVGNAGISGPPHLIEEMPLEGYEKVMAITATSIFLGAKHAGPELLKHPGKASVVNIASVMSSARRFIWRDQSDSRQWCRAIHLSILAMLLQRALATA